jgi:hypothetical protein
LVATAWGQTAPNLSPIDEVAALGKWGGSSQVSLTSTIVSEVKFQVDSVASSGRFARTRTRKRIAACRDLSSRFTYPTCYSGGQLYSVLFLQTLKDTGRRCCPPDSVMKANHSSRTSTT